MKIKTLLHAVIIHLCFFLVQATAWEGPDISGYVSQNTVYRVADSDNPHDKDLMKVEERLRIDLKKSVSLANFFVSGDAIYDPKAYNDWVDDDFSERYHPFFFRLKEAYMDLGLENFDLRLGNQVIVWGKSDGMPITDVITPQDFSEYVLPDFEDMRLGIPAAKLKYYIGDFNLEGVLIPWFYESNIPHSGNWKLSPDYDEFEEATKKAFSEIAERPTGGIHIIEGKPDSGWNEVEFGTRVSGLVADTDIALIFFHGREDTPSVSGPNEWIGIDPATPLIVSRIDYARMNMLGLDFTRPWSKFVLRGEVANFFDKRFHSQKTITWNDWTDPDFPAKLKAATHMFKKDMLQFMVGSDFSGITNVTLSLQFEGKYILNFDRDDGLIRESALGKTASDLNETNAWENLNKLIDIMASDDGKLEEFEKSLTVSATGRFMQDTLQPQLLLLYNIDYEDYYLKLSLGYNISDALWAYVGFYYFQGDRTSVYGMVDENDSIFFKLKYSF